MKLPIKSKKRSLVVEFVRRSIQAKGVLIIITKQNMMNPIQTSAKFAWRFLQIKLILIFTQEFIQERNHLYVLPVVSYLLKKVNYKITKQLIVRKENTSVTSALKEDSSKQNVIWANIWFIILNQNMNVNNDVNNVERSFINHHIWSDTWKLILILLIRVFSVERNFILRVIWNDMKKLIWVSISNDKTFSLVCRLTI